MLNEPTAAALAYGLDKLRGERTILVFDLGGGTFDVTLITIDHGVFEVLATTGDTRLGGRDFDERIIDYLLQRVKRTRGGGAAAAAAAVASPRDLAKLRAAAERAKIALSSAASARVELELGGDAAPGDARAAWSPTIEVRTGSVARTDLVASHPRSGN